MSSGFFHVPACDSISFFSNSSKYSIICIYNIFFIHLSINGYLGCFHILTILSNDVKNMERCIYLLEVLILIISHKQKEGLLDHTIVIFLTFRGIFIPIFIIVPTNRVNVSISLNTPQHLLFSVL